jgi:nucleoside phosphorylase
MTETIHVKRLRGRIDFAVITIREDEFEAVLNRFCPRQPVMCGKQLYEYCRMQRPDGRIVHVAIVRAFDQGQSAAQSVARDTIEDLDPQWILLAGIAGGTPDSEFSLGDVLLANSLHDFSVTAAIQDERPQFRLAGGPMHPRVERLLGTLPAWRDRLGSWNREEALGIPKPTVIVPDDIRDRCYYGSDEARASVRNSLQAHFPATGNARLPQYRIGAAATSNVLLKDADLLSEWQRSVRHLTHIEMEAGGTYYAVRHSKDHEIPLLCVRGLSDIVGFRRSPEWTLFACNVAASFLHALVSILPLEMFADSTRPSTFPTQKYISQLPGNLLRWLNVCRESFGTLIQTWHNRFERQSLKTPTLETIVKAFENSSLPLLSRIVDSNDRIPRAETNALEQIASDDNTSRVPVTCVLGTPGSGKTALLALVVKNAIDSGKVTLGIKADMMPTSMSFEAWGQQQLGLGLTPLDAVKAVSSQSRVLVVIDQLDALASAVDLTSNRLNSVIEFIERCSLLQNVAVVCSCRHFDFYNDVRFPLLAPKVIELELPAWSDVAIQLTRHGITDTTAWPDSFRELLRTPQHLQLYLNRFDATGKTDPFSSYHLMLDDLWTRMNFTSAERDILDQLTTYLIQNEALWAPFVRFEDYQDVISTLGAKGILLTEDRRIGFRHQTLLEHAKARLFTKNDKPFYPHVLERQDAILVRPTVWAVLRYIRYVDHKKYRIELDGLFNATLRLHLRYLLIDFLGQVSRPEDYEVAHFAQRCLSNDDRVRALIAIRGSSEWFYALQASHFPIIMLGPMELQWPMIGVIAEAWGFARDSCLDLVERYWLPDPAKDRLTWRAMHEIGKWDSRAIELIKRLIRRAGDNRDSIHWSENIVSAISADQPQLAPAVFIDIMSERGVNNELACDSDSRRVGSPLDSDKGWYELAAVAEAAPIEFLRAAWKWFLQVCETYHSGGRSAVVAHYNGFSFSLDEQSEPRNAPILSAICAAVDATAVTDPDAFVEITEPSWLSECMVVHRVLIRGILLASRGCPQIGLQYLRGDSRRFSVGTSESDRQSDSIELIRVLVPGLTVEERLKLEDMIFRSSIYRDVAELCEKQKEWDREARLRLLSAFPPELLSPQAATLVESEKAALPNWNCESTGLQSRGGFVRQIPPISKSEMLAATNEAVLSAISASQNRDRSFRKWTEVEGGWEEPGGIAAAGHELAELAIEHPQRAVELMIECIAAGFEPAVSEAILVLAKSNLSDDDVLAFVRAVAALNPHSEELRSSVGSLLYRRSREHVGLPDDICDLLEKWLSEPWDSSYSIFGAGGSVNQKDETESILWSDGRGIIDTDRSFFPLLAITRGYLMRSPPSFGLWLNTIERHLHRNISDRTWAAYCTEFRWIRLNGCDQIRGGAIIGKLFERNPKLRERKEAIRLVARMSDLLSSSFVEEILDQLRTSMVFASRQAFGELLTLIAFRDKKYAWAMKKLHREMLCIKDPQTFDEPIAVGIAFAAAHLFDESQVRLEASHVLRDVIPHATDRIRQAIATVFWACESFAADEATESLLGAFTKTPNSLSGIGIVDLVEHLMALLPHKRELVLDVCNAILKTGREEADLFEVGPHLVKIAMTLQRFPDTRSEGLLLLENLLRLGLDDAFRILSDIDIRPSSAARREPRKRRRRRRS